MVNERSTLQIRLEERMAAKKLKASPLATAMGKSDSFVRDILRGKTKVPSAENLDRMAAALGTTTDYLLGKTDQAETLGPAVEVSTKPLEYGGRVQAGAFLSIDDYFSQDEDGHIPDFVTTHPSYARAKQYAWLVVGSSMDLVDIKDGMWIVGVEYLDYIDQYRDVETGDFVIVERIRAGGHEREVTVKEVRFYRDRMELIPRSSDPSIETIVVPHDMTADSDAETVKIKAVVIAAYRDFSRRR